MNAFIRMKLGLLEDTPTIKPYDQEKWAETADALTLPPAPSLGIIAGLHERRAVMLDAVPDSAWLRPVNHPEHGLLTLHDFLNIYANHCTKHLGHITGLVDAKSW